MRREGADFYGRALIVLFLATIFALGTQKPSYTGLVTAETEVNTFFDVKTFEGDPRTCADGALNGECSTLIKPKFCSYGTLVDHCELCGCDAGEICQNRECVSAD
jgi:hypothetical protein